MNELAPVASEIVNKIESAIQVLSLKMGVASEHLWTILIKQAYINAITSGIIFLIVVSIMISWYTFARFWYKEMNDDAWADEGIIPLWIASIVVCLFGLIISGSALCDLVGYVLNPEYYALSKILAQIK